MHNSSLIYTDILNFFRGKRVLVTGHTGFKGTWLSKILLNAGAIVTGYSLNPPTEPSLFALSGIESSPKFKSVIADIRDLDKLKAVFSEAQPEVVFHLAAQPIVRESYIDPVCTYSTNVLGTVNILEAARCTLTTDGHHVVRSLINVTTDKVYLNNEWSWGYRENEPLDGFDPYSNSKSCSELVTHSYKNSFFADGSVAISTARAGNVIGGGDFANDRIIPDSIRAMERAVKNVAEEGIIGVRNPYSTRPYQHVLEPLFVYLTIAAKQYVDGKFADYYNVGPDDCDCVTTGELVDLFCKKWNNIAGSEEVFNGEECWFPKARWENHAENNAPHEANFLKLDCSKIKSTIGWKPRWNINECMDKTVRFSKIWIAKKNIEEEMDKEISDFVLLLDI